MSFLNIAAKLSVQTPVSISPDKHAICKILIVFISLDFQFLQTYK